MEGWAQKAVQVFYYYIPCFAVNLSCDLSFNVAPSKSNNKGVKNCKSPTLTH